MRRRQRYILQLLIPFVLVLIGLCSPAMADHTSEQRITDETAYTLRKAEVRAGLWKLEVGATDSVTLSTYTLPWFGLAANAGAKWRFYNKEPWAISTKLSVFRLNLGTFLPSDSGTDATLLVVPLEGHVSYRFRKKPLSLSGGLVSTLVRLDGNLDDDEARGAAAVSSLMLTGNMEYRWSERTSIVAFVRYIALQEAGAEASVTIGVDDFTEVRLVGGANAEGGVNVGTAVQLGGAMVWSWDTFNLRLGLGVGNNLILPGINIAVPVAIPLPELDLYWIF